MPSLRVVVPNRPGLLAELASVLGERDLSIDRIEVVTHEGGALVRMDVSDGDRALEVLTDAGYDAVSDDVLLARIEDRAGELARLSRKLAEAGLNIRSLHHVRRDAGYAVVAISTDDNARAHDVIGTDALS